MYTFTRQEAAEEINVSTRSIDRYVKSGKIRSKKLGKIIYLHADDVKNIGGINDTKKPEVIIPKEDKTSYTSSVKSGSREIQTENQVKESSATLEKIYLDLRSEIKTKDQAIQDLALKLGRAEEIAKNSVSLVEFKKSQFLLEESKNSVSSENSKLREKAEELKEKLKYEKLTNIILIVFCIILLCGFGLLWFLRI